MVYLSVPERATSDLYLTWAMSRLERGNQNSSTG